jgi:hypothetical protein
MKKTRSTIIAVCLLTAALFSCSKETPNPKNQPMSTIQPTPSLPPDFIDKIKSDPDWNMIVKANVEIMDQFVNRRGDATNTDLTDKKKFLAAVHISEADYLSRSLTIKACASRILMRYHLPSQQFINGECVSCGENDAKKIEAFKKEINYYQHHPEDYLAFRTSLLEVNKPNSRYTYNRDGCCTANFYFCCAICAATIEAFPVYLGCCYLCSTSYCCPAAPTLN